MFVACVDEYLCSTYRFNPLSVLEIECEFIFVYINYGIFFACGFHRERIPVLVYVLSLSIDNIKKEEITQKTLHVATT